MAASTPLKGTDLVDCAQANAKQGPETAAKLCGYGDDIPTFTAELKKACDRMGIEITQVSDLITEQQARIKSDTEVIAPETPTNL
ncbi:hypothetical protein [Coleofasciculus sp. G2-EDA-02]|uniref:hypothetical protein n=1 Tax=Coleofasciculus sp. G2-EDA-02 TaxID=3069529 RepID=UPI0032F699AC